MLPTKAFIRWCQFSLDFIIGLLIQKSSRILIVQTDDLNYLITKSDYGVPVT